MRVTAQTLPDAEKEQLLEKAKRMSDAYEVFTTAVSFTASSNIVAWDDSKYEESVKMMVSLGVSFTVDQEKMMVQRAANKALSSLSISSPMESWKVAYGIIKPDCPIDVVEFDPLEPRVCSLNASAKECVKFSARLLVNHVLAPVLEGITFETTAATQTWLTEMAKLVVETEEDADEECQGLAIDAGVAMR
eukprot:4902749-Pyramimonas_sp.AAC.1